MKGKTIISPKSKTSQTLTSISKTLLLLCLLLSLAACYRPNAAKTTAQPAAGGVAIPTTPGEHIISIDVNGVTRWLNLIIPPGYDHSEPRPILFFFHGGGLSMHVVSNSRTDLVLRVAEENWIIASMNGSDKTDNRGAATWNAIHCCNPSLENNYDDIGFVREAFAVLTAALKVDTSRVYAMGGSNGAMFTHRLAAEAADIFTAAAENAGTIGGQIDASSRVFTIQPSGPFPIMLTHGMADQKVNFNGGQTSEGKRLDISFQNSVEFWVQNNQCDPNQQETAEYDGLKGKIYVVTFNSCANNTQVRAVRVEKFGHSWPSLEDTGFDTTNAMIDFLKQFTD